MHHLLLHGSRRCCSKEDETILAKTPENQREGEDPSTNPIEGESDEPVISDDLDEISWLNEKDNSLAEGIRSTEGDRFTLAGLEGIKIRSPWLRRIVGSAPTKQTQRSAASAPDLPSSSQIVPNASTWEIWE